MAAPDDLIAPASDYVYVYRGHCVAPARRGCLQRAIHSRNAPLRRGRPLNKAGEKHAVAVKHKNPLDPARALFLICELGQNPNVSTPESQRESNERGLVPDSCAPAAAGSSRRLVGIFN